MHDPPDQCSSGYPLETLGFHRSSESLVDRSMIQRSGSITTTEVVNLHAINRADQDTRGRVLPT